MMVYPSINEEMETRNIKSKYSLVIITAKRARDIVTNGQTFTECSSNKPVSIAINEIYENKVSFKSTDSEPKPVGEFVLFKDDETVVIEPEAVLSNED